MTKTAIVRLLRDLLVDYRTGQDPLVASLRTNELDSQTRCRYLQGKILLTGIIITQNIPSATGS